MALGSQFGEADCVDVSKRWKLRRVGSADSVIAVKVVDGMLIMAIFGGREVEYASGH